MTNRVTSTVLNNMLDYVCSLSDGKLRLATHNGDVGGLFLHKDYGGGYHIAEYTSTNGTYTYSFSYISYKPREMYVALQAIMYVLLRIN